MNQQRQNPVPSPLEIMLHESFDQNNEKTACSSPRDSTTSSWMWPRIFKMISCDRKSDQFARSLEKDSLSTGARTVAAAMFEIVYVG
jgi:hypothetical protein